MQRSIETKIWNDPKIMQLDPNGLLLFLYVLLADSAHFSGIYALPDIMVQHHTRLKPQEIRQQWERLAELKLAFRDEVTETVWVTNMLRYQCHGTPSERIITAVQKHLQRVHSPKLIHAFLDYYRDYGIDSSQFVLQSDSIHVTHDASAENTDSLAEILETNGLDADDSSFDHDPSIVHQDELALEIEEAEYSPTVPSKPDKPQRRFSDRAENLVNLWNEKAPKGMPRIRKITEGFRKQILAALKDYPDRADWERIIEEYHRSEFLRRKDDGHIWKDLHWLVSRGKDRIENYTKVFHGRYRDEQQHGRDPALQAGIAAATRIMHRMGIDIDALPTHPFTEAHIEGDDHGQSRLPAVFRPTPKAGESLG